MTLPHDFDKLQSRMSAAVKAHWKAFLFEGILLVVLGIAAMIVPPLASLAITIFLGWMFLISGIGGLFVTWWARNMPGFWWSLISAALAVLAGGVLLARPVQGVLSSLSSRMRRSSVVLNMAGSCDCPEDLPAQKSRQVWRLVRISCCNALD